MTHQKGLRLFLTFVLLACEACATSAPRLPTWPELQPQMGLTAARAVEVPSTVQIPKESGVASIQAYQQDFADQSGSPLHVLLLIFVDAKGETLGTMLTLPRGIDRETDERIQQGFFTATLPEWGASKAMLWFAFTIAQLNVSRARMPAATDSVVPRASSARVEDKIVTAFSWPDGQMAVQVERAPER